MRGGGGGGFHYAPAGGHPGYGHNSGFAHIRFNTGYYGYGYGYGLGWGGYGYPYSYGYGVGYPYYGYSYLTGPPVDYGYSYAASTQPAVTVVYGPAQQQPQPIVVEQRARPVTREYDDTGREVQPAQSGNSSPIYLFAFQDQSIRAASSYRIENQTLHYVTLQREEKQAPLGTLDRELTLQLNRERRIAINIP